MAVICTLIGYPDIEFHFDEGAFGDQSASVCRVFAGRCALKISPCPRAVLPGGVRGQEHPGPDYLTEGASELPGVI